MNWEPSQLRIKQFLESNWTATAINWPNSTFSPAQLPAWIAPSFLPVGSFTDTLNGALGAAKGQREVTLLVIQVFTPDNTGSHVITNLIDTLATLLNRRRISLADGSQAIFDVGDPKTVGTSSRDGRQWYQMNFSIVYHNHPRT